MEIYAGGSRRPVYEKYELQLVLSYFFFWGGGGRAVGQGYEFREGILADLAVCGADFTVPLF